MAIKTVPHADRAIEAQMTRTVLNPLIHSNYYELDQLCFPDLTLQIAEVKAKDLPMAT